MEDILAKLLVADSSIIQQGTVELREAFKKPESTSILCQIVASSANPEIRQYAGVLLRKRYSKGKNWNKLPVNIRTEVKTLLLGGLARETEQIVKSSIAQFIGTIVKHELEKNTWPELFQYIQQLVMSENIADKELAMFTLATMTEISAESYIAHADSLMTLLSQTYESLQQQYSNSTAYYIMKTMEHLAPLADSKQSMVNAYNQMLPMTMATVQSLIETNQMEKAIEAMQLYDELSEYAFTIMSFHIKSIIPMCLIISRNKSLTTELRVKAIELIGGIARSKTKSLLKHKLIEPIVNVLFELLTTPPEDENEEIYFSGDEDEDTVVTCATEVLDTLALNLSPEKLIPHLLVHIEPALQGSEIYAKKAAYLTIAVLAEGCAEYIRTKYLKDFLCCICQGIRESNPVIRNAALFALGQFSEHLQPDISQYSQDLMPVLIDYLGEICRQLKQNKIDEPSMSRMFYALETFCETLNESLLPYLPTMMDKLFEILESDSSPVTVRELALSAIGASANASKENMLPYFPRIINIIDVYVSNSQTDETTCLQVQAVDTLGVLARTIGEVNFLPLVKKSMDLGIKLITSNDDPDIRKAVYGLFASLAKITKYEMFPILPQILEYIFNSMQSSEGVLTHAGDCGNSAIQQLVLESLSDGEKENEDEEDIENTDNEDEDDDDDENFTVLNSYLEEKEEAILALREIALYTEKAFAPFLNQSIEKTFEFLSYPQDDIRRAAIEAMTQFCITFSSIKSEFPEGSQNPINVFLPKLSEIIRLDAELPVVITGLEALSELLKELKEEAVAADGHKLAVMNCITEAFTGQIACLDQDETEFEDEAEQDEYLYECTGEVLSNLGKSISDDEFAQYFHKAVGFLEKRLKESKSDSHRAFAVGTIAECLAGMGYNTGAFFPNLLKLFKQSTDDSSPEVRNNAYYGIGELVYHSKDTSYPYFNEIIQLLAQRLPTEVAAGPRDNMIGVIARLLITNHTLVDIERVFPVFVQQLPLKEDFEEHKSVFQSILLLYQSGHEIIKKHIQDLIKVAITVIRDKKTESEETKEMICKFITWCHKDFATEWASVFNELPPAVQQEFSS